MKIFHVGSYRSYLIYEEEDKISLSLSLSLSTNWIKPLHKGGDVNNVNNYRTIMVGSLMAKLFGCIMESKISAWVEKNGKRAYGHAGF